MWIPSHTCDMLALKIKCACIAINVKKIKFNSLLVVAMTTGASVLMLHRMTGTVLGDGYYSKRIVCSNIVP